MGIFSGIGKAIKKVAGAANDFLDPIKSVTDTVGSILGATSPALGYIGTTNANKQNIALAKQQMDFQAQQNKIAQDFNAASAQKQMDFQTQMRSSAYQTAVTDMKAAGLNPMLAYSQGGAATPSGAMASSPSPPQGARTEVKSALGATAELALNAASVQKQLEVADANISKIDAESTNIGADTMLKMLSVDASEPQSRADLNRSVSSLNSANYSKVYAEIRNLDTQNQLNQKQIAKVGEEIINLRKEGKKLDVETLIKMLEKQGLDLGMQEKINMNKAQKEWFFREIAPYVDPGTKIMNSASGAIGIGEIMKLIRSGKSAAPGIQLKGK